MEDDSTQADTTKPTLTFGSGRERTLWEQKRDFFLEHATDSSLHIRLAGAHAFADAAVLAVRHRLSEQALMSPPLTTVNVTGSLDDEAAEKIARALPTKDAP